MVDLISRSEVLERLDYYISHSTEPERYAYNVAHREVSTAPVVDAVPVVRCGDCTWRMTRGFCPKRGCPVSDGFYCANGTTQEIQRRTRGAK